MNDAFDAYLSTVKMLCPEVSVQELNYIREGLSISKLNTRGIYINANAVQREIGFVYSGLLRGFYIDKYGNQISIKFIRAYEFATHFSAFITHNPSKYYFQCLEPTVIVNIPYEHIQAGYRKFPILERYGRLVAEEVLKGMQKRIESFLFETAEERYLNFLSDYPDLIGRVSISNLSTFLGIERQSLTRIRKKISDNANLELNKVSKI
ncbi:Crp/Fnr family transcriptional regulator [Flavobacterium sp.]|jgi:CRP/FNR family transcriptional regulator|uniref:Crp/Fnr family transcriptional regulator n=1 Tax=Flavobacterium sp. TaxID=239 RepID=UPI0022C76CAC|nr:Crp/Fnr family transcriptional regulator [Flavobacterium sp.]MCZ8296191.1 Crp/Fnr family transcriptional regulator [Flavobacterium sp.]